MKEKLMERNRTIFNAMGELLIVIDNYSTIDASIREGMKMKINETKNLINQIENKTFTVAVVATVKAGKSTFLNALLGNEYLPTSNVPETSNILYIKHTKGDTYLQRNSEKISGQMQIYETIKERNRIFRDHGVDSIEKFILYVPYKKIENIEGVYFQFVDSPGPNESGNLEIKKQVENILQIADVIVYLLDFTKLNTNDEDSLFDEIKSIRGDLFSEVKNRLFFVINKIDAENTNSLTVDQTMKFVANTLNRILDGDCQYNIYAIKAERALLARMIKNDNFYRIDDLGKVAFGDFGWKKDYPQEKKLTLLNEHLDEIIQDSGMYNLEDKIIDYIVNNSESLFYKSIVEKSIKIINDTENLLIYKSEISKKDEIEIKRMSEDLRKKITSIGKSLDDVDSIVKSFADDIQKDIKKTFNTFEEYIVRVIGAIIKYKKDEKGSEKDKEIKFWRTVEGFADSAADVTFDFTAPGKTKTDKRENRKIMKHIYEFGKNSLKLVLEIIENWNSSIEASVALEKMQTLNTEIGKIVEIAFETIRQELETDIAYKNNQINRDLETIINKANRDFFAYLNHELKIDLLKGSEIKLPEATGLELSTNYDDFIDKKYKKESGGFCKPKIDVLQAVGLKKDELTAWWSKEISKQKVVSLRIVSSYIDSNVLPRIEVVKNTFDNISRNYLSMIDTEYYNIKNKGLVNSEATKVLEESIKKLGELHKKVMDEHI